MKTLLALLLLTAPVGATVRWSLGMEWDQDGGTGLLSTFQGENSHYYFHAGFHFPEPVHYDDDTIQTMSINIDANYLMRWQTNLDSGEDYATVKFQGGVGFGLRLDFIITLHDVKVFSLKAPTDLEAEAMPYMSMVMTASISHIHTWARCMFSDKALCMVGVGMRF